MRKFRFDSPFCIISKQQLCKRLQMRRVRVPRFVSLELRVVNRNMDGLPTCSDANERILDAMKEMEKHPLSALFISRMR